MTPKYYFQHIVLRNLVENTSNNDLKNIIDTKNFVLAKDLFKVALQSSKMEDYIKLDNYDCKFYIKNNIPLMVYFFDKIVEGIQPITECYAAIIVAECGNAYFTVEYSYDKQFVIGCWEGNEHINYGLCSQENFNEIITTIIDKKLYVKKNTTDNNNNVDNKTPAIEKNVLQDVKEYEYKDTVNIFKQKPQIETIKILQKWIFIITILLLVYTVIFVSCIVGIKENNIPEESKALSVKLTDLDSNAKAFCEKNDSNYYVYQKSEGVIKVYKFINSSMYSSSNVVLKGKATSVDIKNYFGKNVLYGKPNISYVTPAAIPVGVVIYTMFIVTIVILLVFLHRRSEEVIFKLNKSDNEFIDNKTNFDEGNISKSEYIRTTKNLLSNSILHNNKIEKILKIFY